MKFQKNLIQKVLILLLILSLLVACQEKDEKIKIGIMTMTTGDVAFLGQNIVRSAELALEDLEHENQVELIVEDVGSLGGGRAAVAAYRKLVDLDKVQFIIDGMTSDGTMAVAPMLDNDKVVMITPLTGGENIDNAARYLFRNGPSDILAGTKPASEIKSRFGFYRVALFTDNAEYTLDIAKHFRNAFEGEIVLDEIIMPEKTDYRSELTKLQGKNYDAIFILTSYGKSAAYILKQLHELRNEKPVFGNFLAYTQETITVAGEGLEGAYIYDPEFDENSEKTKLFFRKYEEKYGTSPIIPFHTTGTYDALKMGLESINEVGYDGEKIRKYLLDNIQDWEGMNGVVSFDEQGNTQTGFVLKQVKNAKIVPLEN